LKCILRHRKASCGSARFYNGLFRTLKTYPIQITAAELAVKDKIHAQHRGENFELSLDSEETKAYLMIDIVYLEKLYHFFNKLGANTMKKIQEETVRRQDIWMKPVFKNDRSNAVSAI
jgi:hypothetical protein